MNLEERVQEKISFIQQAFMDLKELMVDDRNLSEEETESNEEREAEMEDPSLESAEYAMDKFDAACQHEFPGRPFYRFGEINPEDPAFASGKSLGIPYAVAVRTSEGQNRLLPLMTGSMHEDIYGKLPRI